jgi:AhpD family alkylhydroperoxidase
MTQRMDYNTATPAGVKALGGVYGHISQSGLPEALVNLVYLRVSQINGCAYCVDMHSRDLLKEGMSVEKLVLVPVWARGGCTIRRHRARSARLGRNGDARCRNGRARCRVCIGRRCVRAEATRRPHDRDRSHERPQPNGDQLSHPASCGQFVESRRFKMKHALFAAGGG